MKRLLCYLRGHEWKFHPHHPYALECKRCGKTITCIHDTCS